MNFKIISLDDYSNMNIKPVFSEVLNVNTDIKITSNYLVICSRSTGDIKFRLIPRKPRIFYNDTISKD